MEFINNGKNLIVAFPEVICVLSEKMDLLNIHRFKNDLKLRLLIPNKKKKNYIAYTQTEIKIYRINSSQEINIKPKGIVCQVLAVTIKKAPQLVYTTNPGSIYLTRTDLNRRCFGKIFITKEFLVYQDQLQNNKILIVNLEFNTIFYELLTPLNSYSKIIDCSAYKLFYYQSGSYYLHSLIKKDTVPFELPFSFFSMTFLDGLLFINGFCGQGSGIIAMDFFKNITIEAYVQAIAPLNFQG